MRPQIFTRGDQVTPLKDETILIQNGDFVQGPKFGEVYTVGNHYKPSDFGLTEYTGYWFVQLIEYGNVAIREDCLAPVLPASAIDELVEESLLQEI